MSWYKKIKLKYFSISTHCGLECKQQSIRLQEFKHTITTSQTYDYNEPSIRFKVKHTITTSQTYDYDKQTHDYNKTNIRLQHAKHTIKTGQTNDYNQSNIRL